MGRRQADSLDNDAGDQRRAGDAGRAGEIRVSRYVGAFDGGNILNAKTARSQLIGGITYAIGMALLEETLIDGETGWVVNANVAEYLMPVNPDVPDIQAIVVENDDKNTNPLG